MENGTKRVPFHGILAVGNTQQEAVNHYRLLALGKSVSAFTDEDNSFAFISNSNSALPELFNPMTGEMDVQSSDDLLKSLSFESQSGEVDVHHYVCASSCGAHLVFDSKELVKHCPVCTASVEQGDEDQETDTSESAEDEEELDLGLEDDGESDEDGEDDLDLDSEAADDEEMDLESDEDAEEDAELDLESDVEASSDEDEDDADGTIVAAESLSVAKALFAKTIVSKQGFNAQCSEVGANYVVCSDAECDTHIIGDVEIKECPVCHASVEEPEEVSEEAEDEDSTLDLTDAMTDEDEGDEKPEVLPESESSDDEDEDEDDLDLEDEDVEDEDESDVEAGDDCDEDEDESDDEDESEDEGETEEPSGYKPMVIASSDLDTAIALYSAQLAQAGISLSADDQANHMVCTSADCQAHILSSDEISACPLCQASVEEPEEEGEDDDFAELDEGDDTSDIEDEPAMVDESGSCGTKVSVSSYDALRDMQHDKLDLSYSSNINGSATWTAYYAGAPIAMALAKDAGRNMDIFDEVTFGNAVLAGCRHVGVKATLSEMGFKPIVHEISVSSYVEAEVADRISEARSNIEAEKAEFGERLLAALATSAIGLNRGFFAGVRNPLKDSLFDALASAGVRNPEVLIHNAFKSSSDKYHQQLFSQATAILEKPAEVQESLAKAVLEMSYLGTSTSSASVTSGVEERLAGMGTVTAAAQDQHQEGVALKPQESTSAAGDFGSKMTNVVSGLGRRRS